MCLWRIPSQCKADVTSSIKNADYSQVSAMARREKMTAVLFTSGQEFSRERRSRHPKNLKQAVAGMCEGCKKSRVIRSEGGRAPWQQILNHWTTREVGLLFYRGVSKATKNQVWRGGRKRWCE